MTTKELFRKTARAIAEGDTERGIEYNTQIPDEERHDFFVFLSAVSAGAIEQYFGADRRPDQAEITRFVDGLRYEYRDAEPAIKPLVIEAFIRAFYGEDHLLDDVTVEDQFASMFPLIRTIADRSEHMRHNLEKYFDDAELLVREWSEG